MRFVARPMYGIGYGPIGDLVDLVDAWGLRKIPGAIGRRIDAEIETRTQHAGAVAGAQVEAGVRSALDDAERKAVLFVAGATAGAAAVGALVWLLREHQEGAVR